MTDFQKLIYNTYLRVSRTQAGQPFKYRKDFSDVDERIVLLTLKLAAFFNQYKHVNLEDFFIAPFKIYPGEKVYLEFYLTQKAIKVYTLYREMLHDMSPDCDEQVQSILSSLQFIQDFCIQHKLKVSEYLDFTEEGASVPSFILHLKDRQVNIYVLQGFDDLYAKLFNQQRDWLVFFLGQQFVDKIDSFKIKFFSSKKAKVLVRRGIEKITLNVEKLIKRY